MKVENTHTHTHSCAHTYTHSCTHTYWHHLADRMTGAPHMFQSNKGSNLSTVDNITIFNIQQLLMFTRGSCSIVCACSYVCTVCLSKSFDRPVQLLCIFRNYFQIASQSPSSSSSPSTGFWLQGESV